VRRGQNRGFLAFCMPSDRNWKSGNSWLRREDFIRFRKMGFDDEQIDRRSSMKATTGRLLRKYL
ncbi:MAG: hypothetical protein ABL921_32545, partial [Pirellula sp.]